MAAIKGIPLSKVSPAFLHANSTSHTWVFSAFAEIIDNAYDPDVSASELLIDKVEIRGVPCLIFLDNGAGMDTDHLLKMLSFGFCEKSIYEKQGSHQPIGHYGNGFKSGSMRIGQDALVFTRCNKSASIGFLSQTYLKSVQADSVMIPILEYRLPSLERIKSQESRNNLDAILEYSVFKTENELKEELKALEGSKTGTKIIIYNLKRLQDNSYELDFSSDPADIRCPEAHEVDTTSVYHRPIQQKSSEYNLSLREYCSILFLRPRMKITIRCGRVKSKLVSKSLSNTEIDVYKPTWLSRPVKIIFGFTCETERREDCDYGMMLYHRNRLIKAFEKVGYQRQPNGLGVGVVGVVQVDFLQPIHNKQDFNKDEKFNSVMAAFANKLNDYWNEKKGSNASVQPVVRNLPDWLWAQCDHCLKWRRLPDEINRNSLPEQWYCRMNPDATHNRCDIPEEPEDEDLAVKPTYEKTFKKKQEERKRLQQMEREKEDDFKRRKIMEKEQELKAKEATLRAIQKVAAAQPLQDNRTVMSLQKALSEARRREEQQKRLILQIQEQKKVMEEQRNSLLMMAESLQVANGDSSKEVLQQMSSLVTTLNPSSEKPSSTLAGKRKLDAESASMQKKKVKKNLIIKTESEMTHPSTEHHVDDGGGDDDIDDTPPQSSPARLSNGTKANTPLIKTEVKTKSSVVTRQQRTSISLPSSSETTSAKDASEVGRDEATPSSFPITSKAGQKRRQKGNVMAVIDLTSESEFGELVDVKPDLDELRTNLQESLQFEMTDVKPDKDAVDETLHNKDDNDGGQRTGADLKQEITETTTPNIAPAPSGSVPTANSDAVPDVKEGGTSEILFDHADDDPDLGTGVAASFQDTLEAALTAIQERMQKEQCKQDTSNPDSASPENEEETVIKNETREENSKEKFEGKLRRDRMTEQRLNEDHSVSSFKDMPNVFDNVDNGNDLGRGDKQHKDGSDIMAAKDLQPLDGGDGSDFASDGSVGGSSDYRDYSKVYGKGSEPNVGRTNFNGLSEGSRSNSIEDEGHIYDHCIGIEDESSVRQESAESPDYATQRLESLSETADLVVEGPNSADFSEINHDGDLQDIEENDSSCSSPVEGNFKGAPCPYSPTKGENPPCKLSVMQTLTDNTLRRDQPQSFLKSACEFNGKDSTEFKLPSAASSFVKSENAFQESSGTISRTLKNPDGITNGSSYKGKNQAGEEDEHQTYLSIGGEGGASDNENLTGDVTVNQSQSSESSTLRSFNVQNRTPAGKTKNCRNTSADFQNSVQNRNREDDFDMGNNLLSKLDTKQQKLQKTDQFMQTDLDMAAVDELFSQQDNLVNKLCNHQDVRYKDEFIKIDKSFQTPDLEEIDIKVEMGNLNQCKQDDFESLIDLRTKLSLKSQLLKNVEDRLSETCVNIHKLLGFIVPQAELGEVQNIDKVIRDMVMVSEGSNHLQVPASSNVS